MAHAYIFSGVRGVGKTTTRADPGQGAELREGADRRAGQHLRLLPRNFRRTSLDVLEIDAASNRGIDQIRELREMVRYAPASSRYKVVILDEAHQLTDEASNALLKTLEEPPERVVFILATTRAEDLAETIKSRAQLFQFRALTFQEIAGEIERDRQSGKSDDRAGRGGGAGARGGRQLARRLSLLEQAIAYGGDAITDTAGARTAGRGGESVLDDLVEAIRSQSAERALGLVHRLIARRTKSAAFLPRSDPPFPQSAGGARVRARTPT